MATTGTERSTELSVTASDLAEAMRAGFEARRLLPPEVLLGAAADGLLPEIDPGVRSCARLAEHPPVARPGRFAPVIRCLRRGLLAFLRPWLEMQTTFNHFVLQLHDNSRARINQMSLRLDHLSKALEDCLLRLEGAGGTTLDQSQAPERAQAVPAAEDERIVANIFVHTRLPRPPARVLDLRGAGDTSPLEIASFGYDVVVAGPWDSPLRHPALTAVRIAPGTLPFPDESFDVVLGRGVGESASAEVQRVLRPGGRLILAVPCPRPALPPWRGTGGAHLAALLDSLQRVETLFGVRDGDTWSVSADPGGDRKSVRGGRAGAVALVVAEKV